MSEDFVLADAATLGRFEYQRLGSTTLAQLSKRKIIKGKLPSSSERRKPDGIIMLPKGSIKAVVEVKQPSEFTAKHIPKVIKDYSPIARAIKGCNLIILTDGSKTVWVNPHTEEIIQHLGKDLTTVFDPKMISSGRISHEDSIELDELISNADLTISATNNTLKAAPIIDPTPLAERVWQKIWVTTGKEPEKCLYNVVEIFVFKFLSDIGVLRSPSSFSDVIKYSEEYGNDEALEHYAAKVRKQIRKLFPKGEDGTTIINGTIFVTEKGEPNYSQSSLFVQVLEDFQEFDDEFGSMKNIDRQFKTRLFESFLRQSAGIKALGQYFTPRNVVQSIVRMSGVDSLPRGSRVVDPFCGVGGFILESIAEYPSLLNEFRPVNKKIKPGITFLGYDKGSDEKEDERTIILAKANMLIYLSELLTKYNDEEYLKEFSESVFNSTFHLIRSNLGTFGHNTEEFKPDDPEKDKNKFDLVLTNPPYVTSGSAAMRRAIEDAGLKSYYADAGKGAEGLALEWIIKNLKKGGRALVVVPDGLLNQRKVIERIKQTCIIDSISALPSRTFFSTPKKTYILEVTRKQDDMQQQADPVLLYVISEIGESRDSRRKPIEENDLLTLENVHKHFMVDKTEFETSDVRAKVMPWLEFNELTQWLVERQWSVEERKSLGLLEERSEVGEEEFIEMISSTIEDLQLYLTEVSNEQP